MWLYHRVMSPKDADGMANSVDPDQTAHLGGVWFGSTLFAKANLSLNLRFLWHCMFCFFTYKVIWAATCQNQQSDCAPSEDSDQPWHPPSLIRVFAVHMKKAWVLNYPLSASELWSDCADAQADLSLRWAHSHFVGFVMSGLKYCRYHWHLFVAGKQTKSGGGGGRKNFVS